MITFKNGTIVKDLVIDCALGHSASGIWQYKLYSAEYRKLIKDIKETKTPVIPKSSTRYERIGNYLDLDPRTWIKFVRRIDSSGNEESLLRHIFSSIGIEKK